MKLPYVVVTVLVAVLITVAIEESRMASLRKELTSEHNDAPLPQSGGQEAKIADREDRPEPRLSERRHEHERAEESSETDEPMKGMGETVRKMWDNPAGKSMMTQGVRVAIAMQYDDFIESMNLTREEEKHFTELLGADMLAQQELGMKMLAGDLSDDETDRLSEELEEKEKKNEEAIKTFLNNDEDFAAYETYKERLPERQQLAGIRMTMDAKGIEMSQETEDQLVEAMYRARSDLDVTDYSGPEGVKAMAEGNIVENFERSWEKQQEYLREETAKFMNPEEQEAFFEQQDQMKEMQLMGMRMAEQMMKKDEE